MELLYHQTNNLIQEVQERFIRLEKASIENVPMIENEIQARLDKITSSCEDLDILVNKETAQRRPNAKMRVDQLKYDCQHLQAALRSFQHKRYTRDQELRFREELLSRDFKPNDENTSIVIDQALQYNTSAQNANRGLDDLLGSGAAILGNLREQRVMLKGVQRKVLDVANLLGMSNTTMRFIERRAFQDKFILLGGMIITCIIMFFIYKYLA